jgi:hypothetical protein
MKRIKLQFAHGQKLEPQTYSVTFETDTYLVVKGKWATEMTLTKLPDGTFKNEHHVVFAKVKQDNRPKPYGVRYESGVGEGSKTTRFRSLQEVQEYCKGRWCGRDYIDGSETFHNDYGHFVLVNCELKQLGDFAAANGDGWADFIWKALDGDKEVPAAPDTYVADGHDDYVE